MGGKWMDQLVEIIRSYMFKIREHSPEHCTPAHHASGLSRGTSEYTCCAFWMHGEQVDVFSLRLCFTLSLQFGLPTLVCMQATKK